jgi:hypothetical protein
VSTPRYPRDDFRAHHAAVLAEMARQQRLATIDEVAEDMRLWTEAAFRHLPDEPAPFPPWATFEAELTRVPEARKPRTRSRPAHRPPMRLPIDRVIACGNLIAERRAHGDPRSGPLTHAAIANQVGLKTGPCTSDRATRRAGLVAAEK